MRTPSSAAGVIGPLLVAVGRTYHALRLRVRGNRDPHAANARSTAAPYRLECDVLPVVERVHGLSAGAWYGGRRRRRHAGRWGERLVYFLLLYEVVDDYVERRGAFREAHLALAREAHGRGELLLAGALQEPVDGAALVFKADDATVAQRFAESDPYVLNGLVTNWRVRPWAVVIGGE